jgi:hypothetical protein
MQKKLQFWKLFGLFVLSIGTTQITFAQKNGATSKTEIDTAATPESESVGDVIIIGYGRQSRRNVVGSISTVTGKEITELPTQSFEASLQGKAAGVQSGTQGAALIYDDSGFFSIAKDSNSNLK